MNIIILILQVLLALHTGIGAIWKLMNPTALVTMFPMIPDELWLAICVLEIFASLLLVLPILPFFQKLIINFASRWKKEGSPKNLVIMGALMIAFEMLVFTALYLGTGTANYSPIYYWLVVALVAGFVAYKKKNAA